MHHLKKTVVYLLVRKTHSIFFSKSMYYIDLLTIFDLMFTNQTIKLVVKSKTKSC